MAIYLFYLVIFYATADSDEMITQMFPTIKYGTWSGLWGVFIIIASSLLVISEDWMLFSFKRRYGSSLLNTFSYLESIVFVSV